MCSPVTIKNPTDDAKCADRNIYFKDMTEELQTDQPPIPLVCNDTDPVCH